MLIHEWPGPLIKTISDHDTRKPYTHTDIERRQAFLDDLRYRGFEPLILACLKEEPPTDRPTFYDIHDQLMMMKPKIAVFTDVNISHQVFSRFALGNSSQADQPTPVTQEEHVISEHHQLSVSQHSWVGWFVCVLLGVLVAYIIGGLLRSDIRTL